MPFRFFRIPAQGCDVTETELNQLLSSHRILTVDRRFVDAGENSFWAVCVDFLQRPDAKRAEKSTRQIDYRDVLSPQDFRLFAHLRDIRKELAAKEGVPVYAVLTNQQLAEIVQKSVVTMSDLRQIDGLGDAKSGKYGDALLKAIAEYVPEPEQVQ